MQVDIELYRRDITVNLGDRPRLSVIDIAPEKPSRTLVLLHGFAGNARQWSYQLRDFSDEWRVIAPDLRGHGESAAGLGSYRTDVLVDDLDGLLDGLAVDGPVVLVGHSFGGALAVEYALQHPDRVDRLVLIAAAGVYPLARSLRLALRMPTPLLKLAYRVLRTRVGAPPGVIKRMYRQTVEPWRGWDKFSDIRQPTLIIRGDRDRVFEHQNFEKVAGSIPDAEDINVGASGHMVMLERREAVNRAIERFLSGGRSWRDDVHGSAKLERRPWLAYYEEGVPQTIGLPDVSLDQLLTSAARRFPSRTAILFEGRRTSYRQLERQVNRFAQGLIRLGLLPGERVLFLLPNLPQLVVGFFGTLRAGGVAAFASPFSEPQELLREIQDSGATVLFTLTSYSELASQAMRETDLRHVLYVRIWDDLPWIKSAMFRLTRARRGGHLAPAELPANHHLLRGLTRNLPVLAPANRARPDDLAVLQYTGGTTDLPKGVMLTHRNLLANTLQNRHWLASAEEGREIVLSVLPFSHIYGLTAALCTPIALASTLLVMSGFQTKAVLQAIRRHRPTLFPGVPSMYTAINDFPGVRRYRLDSIQACISGAAPLPVEVQEAFEKLTRGRLVEGYGLTEAGPTTHVNPIHGRRKIGTIGIPVPGTEAKIVDLTTGRDLGVGKIGELAVRGPQVMRGYWNDPELTLECLTSDGWLMTGDLARMDEEGYFQIVARKKEMILAGDYQVFPRDVEEVLYEHPKVREAAVVGIQKKRWPFQRVKAYVVLRSGAQATEDELIDLCRRRLESYAVPWKVEFVDELPKSFVGKVLRRLLIEESAP
jgi:long-chain acyl-CoA synthetase